MGTQFMKPVMSTQTYSVITNKAPYTGLSKVAGALQMRLAGEQDYRAVDLVPEILQYNLPLSSHGMCAALIISGPPAESVSVNIRYHCWYGVSVGSNGMQNVEGAVPAAAWPYPAWFVNTRSKAQAVGESAVEAPGGPRRAAIGMQMYAQSAYRGEQKDTLGRYTKELVAERQGKMRSAQTQSWGAVGQVLTTGLKVALSTAVPIVSPVLYDAATMASKYIWDTWLDRPARSLLVKAAHRIMELTGRDDVEPFQP